MKVGDWVVIVPCKPMIQIARTYIGQCCKVASGPHHGYHFGLDPDEHWELEGVNISHKDRTFWWTKHLMPIDPPDEVKDEETADDHTTKSKTPHKSAA